MAPKAKFTRAQLQEAALALVDEQGLAALSMRTLAGALGTGPMTLYNYVKDRDELDALVVEAVLGEVKPARPRGDWQADVRAIVEATWRTVRRHPTVIPLVLTRRTLHDTTLQWAEGLLEALARSGRRDSELLIAFRTVSGFVMGLAQAQLSGPTADHPDVARAVLAGQPLSAADRDRQGGEGDRARPRVPRRARHRHGGPGGPVIRRS